MCSATCLRLKNIQTTTPQLVPKLSKSSLDGSKILPKWLHNGSGNPLGGLLAMVLSCGPLFLPPVGLLERSWWPPGPKNYSTGGPHMSILYLCYTLEPSPPRVGASTDSNTARAPMEPIRKMEPYSQSCHARTVSGADGLQSCLHPAVTSECKNPCATLSSPRSRRKPSSCLVKTELPWRS